MHTLETFLLTYSDLRANIFDYLGFLRGRYRHLYRLRQISFCFWKGSLYDTCEIDTNTSQKFLDSFLCNNPSIRKLYVYGIPHNFFCRNKKNYFSSVHTLRFEFPVKTQILSLLCFPSITSLKMCFTDCDLPVSILKWKKLQTLDMIITSQDNAQRMQMLLYQNKSTLENLTLDLCWTREIDFSGIVSTIVDHLRLKSFSLSTALFSYPMIGPSTERVLSFISFDMGRVGMLRHLKQVRLDMLKNSDLPIVFQTLELVESMTLYGMDRNYKKVVYDQIDKYPFFIQMQSEDIFQDSLVEPYDGSSAPIVVQSPRLKTLCLSCFTIRSFTFAQSCCLDLLYIQDVEFSQCVFLPFLTCLHIENLTLCPKKCVLDQFDLPRLHYLTVQNCVITDAIFSYRTLYELHLDHCLLCVA